MTEQLFLVAHIAGRGVAIDSAQVESVVDIGHVTPTPRVAKHIRGLAALCSRVVTVIDAHAALGLPPVGIAGSRAVITVIDGHHYAVLVDSLVRASEQAGLTTEIQGFTTLAWNGGRARTQWLARGRPPHPGRLNETCHMVFKGADVSWRRARTDIAALFKADLFREGVDGEAIDWGCQRLAAHDVSRRILVVISDGSPMDAATSQANGPSYLDEHLKDVLLRHETVRDVEVLGLGMGCDLSTFYRHCATVDPAAPLDTKRLLDLAQWIGQRRGQP